MERTIGQKQRIFTTRDHATITVIVPAFRSARTIQRCVSSVLNQTWPVHELLVVEDGVTDDLRAALAQFGECVTLISKPNGGVASARNAGLDRATGDLVAFLDSDDYWEPHKLERQVQIVQAHSEVGLVGANFYCQDPGGPRRAADVAFDWSLCDRLLHLSGADAFRAAGIFWTGTVLVSRTLLGDRRFDESLSLCEDRDLWFRLMVNTTAWLISEPLATYVLEPGSLSRSDANRDCVNVLAVIDKHRSLLGPDVCRGLITREYRRWSTDLLGEGDPRGAFWPAMRVLARAPSVRSAYTAVKAASLSIAPKPPRPKPTLTITVDTVSDITGFRALRAGWDALYQRCRTRTIALTWEWMFTWWEVFREGRELHLLVARDSGRLIGIAPLLLRTTNERGSPVRRLELIATGADELRGLPSASLDFLIEEGRERDAVSAFWFHIWKMGGWDELRLPSVPAESRLRAALRDAAASSGLQMCERPGNDSTVVVLAPPGAELVAEQGADMQPDLPEHRRLIDQHGPIDWLHAHTATDLLDTLPLCVGRHQNLWRSHCKPGRCASPRCARFHKRVNERLSSRDMVHLTLATAAGKPVAARYGFHVGDRFFECQSGFASESETRATLGRMSAEVNLEWALGAGVHEYHLGPGDGPHHLRWKHLKRETFGLVVTRTTSRALAARAVGALGTVIRRATSLTSGNASGDRPAVS